MIENNSHNLDEVFYLLDKYKQELDRAAEKGEIEVCNKWELLRCKREDLLIQQLLRQPQRKNNAYGLAA